MIRFAKSQARLVAQGSLTYAVGDVHGCLDLVRLAHDRVRRHARGRPHRIIFLGDYIDRGVEIRRTVEHLMALQESEDLVCLKGNHEDMLLRVLHAPGGQDLERWLEHGGRSTARSYGAFLQLEEIARYVPDAHARWLADLPLILESDQRIYVHAGIDPAVALTEQGAREFLWIRETFLAASAQTFVERRHVVHGHAMQWRGKPDPRRPELLAHRTNLDTGAYATGVLTVGVFLEDRPGGPTDILTIS